MEGGIFLLLCLLALVIGSRVRNSRSKPQTEKAIQNQMRVKKIMIWVSLVLISIWVLLLIPSAIELTNIAIHTHFDWDTVLSVFFVIFGLFTIYSIVRQLKKMNKE